VLLVRTVLLELYATHVNGVSTVLLVPPLVQYALLVRTVLLVPTLVHHALLVK
jgi:hypothetical protein